MHSQTLDPFCDAVPNKLGNVNLYYLLRCKRIANFSKVTFILFAQASQKQWVRIWV